MSGRVTRATTRASMPPPSPSPKKRAAPTPATPPSNKRSRNPPESPYIPPTPRTEKSIHDAAKQFELEGEKEGAVLLHPPLQFKFEDARDHLIKVDERWKGLMEKLECKPFQGEQSQNEPFNPFKSLVSSILGQQVSWLAARSIQNKFCRIWTPSLPEKLPPPDSGVPRIEAPFPTPHQVVDLEDRTERLRGAGLSGRKVEYIVGLAEKFVDGTLDAKKLWGMDDEEVMKVLTDVRGIGVWTVQMFMIFSLKRQNINPVGDLGIQKGLARWYSCDPTFVPLIHPRKLPATGTKKDPTRGEEDRLEEGVGKLDELGAAEVERSEVVQVDEEKEVVKEEEQVPEKEEGDHDDETKGGYKLPPTSNNLTPAILKQRLSGKKIKGAYLTPTEMEELMKPFEPYRSVVCYYLWSVTDKD